MVFSVVQDLNRDLTLPLVVMSPRSPPIWEIFHSFSDLPNLDSPESYFVECLQFEFLGCFLRIRLRLCIFGKNRTETMLCPSQHFTCLEDPNLIYPISGGGNFDHLGTVLPHWFLWWLYILKNLRTSRPSSAFPYKIWRSLSSQVNWKNRYQLSYVCHYLVEEPDDSSQLFLALT